MAQYSFPILENDELLPCMEEMELPITAAQMAKPTYDVVGPLFESVLISLTGITRCARQGASSSTLAAGKHCGSD
jgi:kinetochore protein Nuf2